MRLFRSSRVLGTAAETFQFVLELSREPHLHEGPSDDCRAPDAGDFDVTEAHLL